MIFQHYMLPFALHVMLMLMGGLSKLEGSALRLQIQTRNNLLHSRPFRGCWLNVAFAECALVGGRQFSNRMAVPFRVGSNRVLRHTEIL